MANQSSESHQQVQERWDQIRGEIKSRWPQLDDSDLEQIDGDSQRLVALVHQKTGDNLSDIHAAIDDLASRSQGLLSRLTRSASAASQRVSQTVSDSYAYARGTTQRHPIETVAFAFGTGVFVGVCMTLLMTPEPQPRGRWDRWWH